MSLAPSISLKYNWFKDVYYYGFLTDKCEYRQVLRVLVQRHRR